MTYTVVELQRISTLFIFIFHENYFFNQIVFVCLPQLRIDTILLLPLRTYKVLNS